MSTHHEDSLRAIYPKVEPHIDTYCDHISDCIDREIDEVVDFAIDDIEWGDARKADIDAHLDALKAATVKLKVKLRDLLRETAVEGDPLLAQLLLAPENRTF
jgi:hypothetical protein